jgi:hypothetical protein
MPCIQFFYGPNRPLSTLTALMTFIAFLCIFLNIYTPEINYHGIWGLSNVVFAVLVACVFYIGTKFDQREDPAIILNFSQTTQSIRFWACLSQAACLICLNTIQFYMDYSNVMNAFRALTTIIVILGTNWLKMDLIYREVGEVFSMKLLHAIVIYAVIAVFYVISFLVSSKSGSDMRNVLNPLLYFFSYIQWVIIAALISGIYRDVRIPVNPQQHVEVVVQREPVVCAPVVNANANNESSFYPRPILNIECSSSFSEQGSTPEQGSTLIRNPDAASASCAV